MNPSSMMKLMTAKKQFETDHPKFAQFLENFMRTGVEEGSIIEISVTRPDGTKTTTNMKVKASDLELVSSLKDLAN